MNTAFRNNGYKALLALALLLAGVASAADNLYKFEMVVFERPGAAVAASTESEEDGPQMRLAGRLDGLATGNKRLGPVAYTLKQRGMIVHEHLA